MRKYLLLIFFALFSFSAIHAEIEWTLSDDGTLTISGTDMPDYGYIGRYYPTSDNTAPWYSQREKILNVVIEKGVKNIGNCAFYGCSCLTSAIIPNSVTSIGSSAFYYCSCLTSVIIPNSVTNIGYEAFRDCSALTSITIPNSVKDIKSSTFQVCI